jgi:hypothetical protein
MRSLKNWKKQQPTGKENEMSKKPKTNPTKRGMTMGQDSKKKRRERRERIFKATNKCKRTDVGGMRLLFPNRFRVVPRAGKDGVTRDYIVVHLPKWNDE